LKYWRVQFEGIPEAALNTNAVFSFHKDSLQQGETLNTIIGIENISNFDMDSLLVKFSIINQMNQEITSYQRLSPLKKGDILVAEYSLDTRQLENINNFVLEVNPDNDQIESYHLNNFLFKQFFVEKDIRNPILDITFDGKYIQPHHFST